MKISVCIPVIGRGRMLSRALYSVLMQDYDDIEIVLKDGNPDSPVTEDPYVRDVLVSPKQGWTFNYAVGKDGGIFPAVNDCLKRATGDILYFMCSDDLLCPGAFHTINQVFEEDRFGGALWAYGKTVSADALGRTQGIDGEPPDWEKLRIQNCIGQPSTFWNRQMMDLAGMFDLRYKHAADYDLWLRFWKRREPKFVNRTLGIFCHHENQDTSIHSQDTEKEAHKIASRFQMFSSIMERARNLYVQKKAYGGEDAPVSHDET